MHPTSLAAARQRGTRAGPSAQVRRSSLRCDCLAVLGLVAPPRNSLRSLRSLRSNRRGESEHEARGYARGPQALRSSAPHMRAGPGPGASLRDLWWRAWPRTPTLLQARRRARPGRGESAPPRNAGLLAARALGALRHLTRRMCLSAVSAANAAKRRASRLSPAQAAPGALLVPMPTCTSGLLRIAAKGCEQSAYNGNQDFSLR